MLFKEKIAAPSRLPILRKAGSVSGWAAFATMAKSRDWLHNSLHNKETCDDSLSRKKSYKGSNSPSLVRCNDVSSCSPNHRALK